MKVHLQVPLYRYIADLAGKTNFRLPVPAFTVINGGKYAGNSLPIQVRCIWVNVSGFTCCLLCSLSHISQTTRQAILVNEFVLTNYLVVIAPLLFDLFYTFKIVLLVDGQKWQLDNPKLISMEWPDILTGYFQKRRLATEQKLLR